MAASAGAIRVLIAAGGTGGHLYPGIAIAEEWMRMHPDSRVVFVGTTRGPEQKAVPAAGFELRTIAARGLPRRPGLGWILAAYGLVKALVQSFRLVVELKPHVVVGTGSYVSAPAVLVARLFGIPVVLQEQNSIPGATNRWLNLLADEVHISFLESRGYFRRKNNLRVSGNPIRRSLLLQDRGSAYETFGLGIAEAMSCADGRPFFGSTASRTLMLRSEPLTETTLCRISRSAAPTSRASAARSSSCLRTSAAAICAARTVYVSARGSPASRR